MDQGIIIVISVIAGVMVMLMAKIWLHNLIKFKMDESAILNLLKEVSPEHEFLSNDTISQKIQLDTKRISQVCIKSPRISESNRQKNSWCLK